MAQSTDAKTYPFDIDAQKADEPGWRHLAGAWGDGIVNDRTGNSFGAVRSPSARTLTVSLDELRIRGIHYEGQSAHSPKTITIPDVASGYTRCDRIVAHYLPASRSVEVELLEGAPVLVSSLAGGQPPVPALVRVSGGEWMLSLYQISGVATNAAGMTFIDERAWVRETYVVESADSLPQLNAALYAVALDLGTGREWLNTLVAGTPTWVNRDDPPWTSWDASNGRNPSWGSGAVITNTFSAPFIRLVRGRVEFKGTLAMLTGAAFGGGPISIGSLPIGYPKPDHTIEAPIAHTFTSADGSSGRIEIGTSGAINLFLKKTAAGNAYVTWVSLDGVSFPASNSVVRDFAKGGIL